MGWFVGVLLLTHCLRSISCCRRCCCWHWIHHRHTRLNQLVIKFIGDSRDMSEHASFACMQAQLACSSTSRALAPRVLAQKIKSIGDSMSRHKIKLLRDSIVLLINAAPAARARELRLHVSATRVLTCFVV